MARTTTALVEAILGGDYDSLADTDLSPYVAAANAVVDRVVACASAKGLALTDTEAELVERYLSGHFYQTSDPGYSSRSTANKSGAFLDNPGDLQTRYMERAILLDYSGCLKTILQRNVAFAYWIGKTDPEKLTYEERN